MVVFGCVFGIKANIWYHTKSVLLGKSEAFKAMSETKRIQVPLDLDVFERVSKLAAANRRTLGAMCVELIDHAFTSDKYRAQEEQNIKSSFKSNAVKAAVHGVDLDRDKLNKLLRLLEAID